MGVYVFPLPTERDEGESKGSWRSFGLPRLIPTNTTPGFWGKDPGPTLRFHSTIVPQRLRDVGMRPLVLRRTGTGVRGWDEPTSGGRSRRRGDTVGTRSRFGRNLRQRTIGRDSLPLGSPGDYSPVVGWWTGLGRRSRSESFRRCYQVDRTGAILPSHGVVTPSPVPPRSSSTQPPGGFGNLTPRPPSTEGYFRFRTGFAPRP